MGRGRAKAKQTKVARELKYSSASLDPDRLKRELAAGGLLSSSPATPAEDDEDDLEDPYARYADEDDTED